MKKMVPWVVLWLASGSALAQSEGAMVPRPVKVGDEAVYQVSLRADNKVFDEIITVTAVEPGQYRVKHVRGNPAVEREGVYTSDGHILVWGVNGSRYNPPVPLVKLPLSVGSAWDADYESTAVNGNLSRAEVSYKVAAQEKIETPAGVFDAFKIESVGWLRGVNWRGVVRVQQTMWYAPFIGRSVRTEYKDYRGNNLWNDTLTELKSFKPAP
ncbi:hypothetical protein [Hydrogenophaga sp.]|uniref:TapB family protein n=1 Tax=Hydrogenophaga sp. TaxID=1904254 RepID=UPI002630BF7E|nr:hypothetical protein [Hydrogenophaga sp.]MCW5655674.1 hypothetical protein [Hydrogenophaga sp.]